MIRITVELVPHGDESKKRKIMWGEIENDQTGNLNVGNYNYKFTEDHFGQGLHYEGFLQNHKRGFGVVYLLHKILDNISWRER